MKNDMIAKLIEAVGKFVDVIRNKWQVATVAILALVALPAVLFYLGVVSGNAVVVFIVAVAALGISAIALAALRSTGPSEAEPGMLPPKLELTLSDPSEEIEGKFGSGPSAPPAFFYHLEVLNTGNVNLSNAKVVVTKIKKNDKCSDRPFDLWWEEAEAGSRELRKLKHRVPARCNLATLVFDRERQEARLALDITNESWTPDFPGQIWDHESPGFMDVDVQAVGDYNDGKQSVSSNVLKLRVNYEGFTEGGPERVRRAKVSITK